MYELRTQKNVNFLLRLKFENGKYSRKSSKCANYRYAAENSLDLDVSKT